MWIYLSDAFLSVVQDTTQPGHLLVRARIVDDIETVFPFATVTCSPERDYAYRASMPRAVVAKAIERSVLGIDYPSKPACTSRGGMTPTCDAGRRKCGSGSTARAQACRRSR
jgi:hypothetical protein